MLSNKQSQLAPARFTHPKSLSLSQIQLPLALVIIVDKKSRVDYEQAVFEGSVQSSLFQQCAFLQGLGEIKGKGALSSSRHL